jgi:glycosyltransferase involved in cell wall biosynthesis
MKVAIVHDFLMQMGGAEKVVEVLHDMYPDAPIYTSAYDAKAMPAYYRTWDIRTSFMQKLIFKKYSHRAALLLYPTAFESFDLSSYDLIISSSSAFAKGVITSPDAVHVCYTHAPMRYVWSTRSYVKNERLSLPMRSLLMPGLHYLRNWDSIASTRVDRYIANSSAVAKRINKFYRRDADVIHPPVDTTRFSISDQIEDYCIVVSRFVPYKRIDLAVEAFTKMNRPLKVVGTGRQLKALKQMAGPTIEFLGHVDDVELPGLMARAKAYIMPGEEDFGIAPVEANACGRPVVAYAAGGALDVQIEGETGLLFRHATAESLCEAVERLDTIKWDPERIRANAMRFSEAEFRRKITIAVASTSVGDRRRGSSTDRRQNQGQRKAGPDERRRVIVDGGAIAPYDRRYHGAHREQEAFSPAEEARARAAELASGHEEPEEARASAVLPRSRPYIRPMNRRHYGHNGQFRSNGSHNGSHNGS